MPFGATVLRLLFLLAVAACLSGEVRAQGLQKLLEGAKGGASGQKSQPSAAEQQDWASERASQLQAREKELDPEALRAEFRTHNWPEARADELIGAVRDAIQDYQAAPTS